jgi:hypothetical protein
MYLQKKSVNKRRKSGMKKKAVSVLLAISMLAAGMMGCGKQAATDSTGAAAETPAAQAKGLPV